MESIGPIQEAQRTATIAPAQAESLPIGDPRRDLVGRPLNEIAEPGSAARHLLGSLHQSLRSSPGLSLRDLPVEVAQQILNNRAETMQQFFDSWSESIQHNAEQEKQATQRRLLAQMLIKAVNAGVISQSEADACGAAAGIPSVEVGVSANEAAARHQAQTRPRAPTVQDAMVPPSTQQVAPQQAAPQEVAPQQAATQQPQSAEPKDAAPPPSRQMP